MLLKHCRRGGFLMRSTLQMLMQVYDKLVKCDELLPVAANEVRNC